MRRRLTDANEGLIRRAWRTGKQKMIMDQITLRHRAPAAAFALREKEPDLSVNVESSLLASRLPLIWQVDLDRQYAARITVGDCEALSLRVCHNPIDPKPPNDPGNPHHGSIFGLAEMRSSDPDAYEEALTALAKASTIVPEPTPSC